MKFNRRQFSARLERLQKSQEAAGPPPAPGPFDLDPTIVETLGHDINRLEYLLFKKYHPEADPGDLTSPEIEELALLQRSVPERLQLIAPSMEGYGVTEYRRDRGLFVLGGYRPKQISAHQIAQARIRIDFFQRSAEGVGRDRLTTLQCRYVSEYLTAAEKTELASLQATYPEVPWDQSTHHGRWAESYRTSTLEAMEKEHLRQKERAKTDPRYREMLKNDPANLCRQRAENESM